MNRRISPRRPFLAACCLLGYCIGLCALSGCTKQPDSEPVEMPVVELPADPGLPEATASPGDQPTESAKPVEPEGSMDRPGPTEDRVPATGEQEPGEQERQASSVSEVTSEGERRTEAPAEGKLEPIFEEWPTPQLALLVTGRQHGYIEPCGCTGLANQKGGLARRHTLLRQLRQRGWPLVCVDVGNQVRRSGRQPEIKFQTTINALKVMGYAAVALGPDDLRLSVDELGAVTASTEQQTSLIVCANAAVYSPELMRRYAVVTAGGKKVGITSIVGSEQQRKVINDLIVMQSPEEALQQVVPKLEAAGCDLLVLLAHTSLDESRQLARQFPQFDVIVTAGGAGEPPRGVEKIAGTRAVMVQTGTKGMYVGVLGFFADPTRPMRYQRVPLDARFADSPEMMALFKAYQEQLKTLGLAGLGLRPVPHPSGLQFVGSERCADCHEEEYDIWKDGVDGQGGPHWHATESLVHPGERSDIPRHYDPECLSCHVTGWNPQGFFPYQTGYLSLEDEQLHGNGCENCHGPGSAHVAAEEEEIEVTDEQLEQLREQMRLTLEEAKQSHCYQCHDLDNSPDFQVEGAFERYWEKIEH